jgi:hypothetical protein
MHQAQLPGVEPELRRNFPAIETIAQHGQSQKGKVYADLMGAARFGFGHHPVTLNQV